MRGMQKARPKLCNYLKKKFLPIKSFDSEHLLVCKCFPNTTALSRQERYLGFEQESILEMQLMCTMYLFYPKMVSIFSCRD